MVAARKRWRFVRRTAEASAGAANGGGDVRSRSQLVTVVWDTPSSSAIALGFEPCVVIHAAILPPLIVRGERPRCLGEVTSISASPRYGGGMLRRSSQWRMRTGFTFRARAMASGVCPRLTRPCR